MVETHIATAVAKIIPVSWNPVNLPYIGNHLSKFAGPLTGSLLLEATKLYVEKVNEIEDIGQRFDDKFYVELVQSSINTAALAVVITASPFDAFQFIATGLTFAYYAVYPATSSVPPKLTTFIDTLYEAEHNIIDSTVGTFVRFIGEVFDSTTSDHAEL